jgi:hypothetical protein
MRKTRHVVSVAAVDGLSLERGDNDRRRIFCSRAREDNGTDRAWRRRHGDVADRRASRRLKTAALQLVNSKEISDNVTAPAMGAFGCAVRSIFFLLRIHQLLSPASRGDLLDELVTQMLMRLNVAS